MQIPYTFITLNLSRFATPKKKKEILLNWNDRNILFTTNLAIIVLDPEIIPTRFAFFWENFGKSSLLLLLLSFKTIIKNYLNKTEWIHSNPRKKKFFFFWLKNSKNSPYFHLHPIVCDDVKHRCFNNTFGDTNNFVSYSKKIIIIMIQRTNEIMKHAKPNSKWKK